MDDGRRIDIAAPAEAAGARHDRYLHGVLLVAVGAAIWSSSGILIRSIESLEVFPLIFYRSAIMAATLLVAIAVTHRGRVVPAFHAAGGLGLLCGACFGGASIGYVVSVTETTVANTVFLASTAPIFAALLSWGLLKERIGAVTWLAMAATIAGIALMVGDGLGAGKVVGNLAALGSALLFAVVTLSLRRGRNVDMTAAMCAGGALAAIAAGLLAGSLAITLHDLLLCLVMGVVQLSVPLFMIVRGARHIPAVQVTLLSLIESVLNPLWVWLGVGEVPSTLTLVGGAVILAAIVGQTLAGARTSR